ncbi:MAG: hypothetical protein ABUK01_12655 [Leptospirales bacterium]
MVVFLILVASLSVMSTIIVSLHNRKIRAELASLQHYERAASRLISENESITDEFVLDFLETLLEMAIQSYIIFRLSSGNSQIKYILAETSNMTHLQSEIVISRLLGKYRFEPLPLESVETFSVEKIIKDAAQLSQVKAKKIVHAQNTPVAANTPTVVKMPMAMARFSLFYLFIAADQVSGKNDIHVSYNSSEQGVEVIIEVTTEAGLERSRAYQMCIQSEGESEYAREDYLSSFSPGLELAKKLTRIYKGKIMIRGKENRVEFLIQFPLHRHK